MYLEITVVLFLVTIFSVTAEDSIECFRILDKTTFEGSELCFYPNRFPLVEEIQNKRLNFTFPMEEFQQFFESGGLLDNSEYMDGDNYEI